VKSSQSAPLVSSTSKRRVPILLLSLHTLLALLLTLLLGCNGGTVLNGSQEPLQIENEKLKVSDFHLNAFVPIEKKIYDYPELPALYESLRSSSDGYCEIIHNRKPFRRDVALKLISEEYLSQFWKDRFWGSFHNLVSGCWNFYIMNDVRPFDDFRLVKSLFPEATKHCYSVGLMQPYIMHNILGCEDLNFLDVDWRIHYAHFQLEQMFRDQMFASVGDVPESIRKLHLGWIAFSPTPVQAKHAVTPATLCRLNQNECMEHLSLYQKNRVNLSSITWNLAKLHDADFPRHPGMPVVYLSNAIEELYTSRSQFDLLLGRVAASIQVGKQALFAYHAAGTDEIGLYRLVRKAEKTVDASGPLTPNYEIETICRDRYHRANTGALKEYTTYFETVSKTQNPTACKTLIQEMDRD